MKKLTLILSSFAFAGLLHAGLKEGDSLQAYNIVNAKSGEKYCQVCQYGAMPAKVAAYGNLEDKEFWADLKKLEVLHKEHGEKLGVFAQVIDSKDKEKIAAAAKENGITFPVVFAEDDSWNDHYKVDGKSRTIYYATGNKIAWTNTGLTDDEVAKLTTQIKEDIS